MTAGSVKSLLRTRAIIAQSGARRLHVIAPDDCLLDVFALGRHLGGGVRVYRAEPLEEVSSTPGAYEYPVVLDERLLAADALELRDELGTLTVVDAADFRRLTSNAIHTDFCVPCRDDPTPLDRIDDRAAINRTLTNFTELRIRERLDDTLSIPPLPEASRRILKLKSNPDYDVRELVRIVEADPSLAARLLGWANSAFYGLRDPVKSIADAITRVLGPDAVLNMSLAIALKADLQVPSAHVRGLSPYWLEAMYSAATMEALANQLPAPHRKSITPGFAYVAGLLANFGTLVIGHVFPPFYARMCTQQEANRHLAHTFIDHQAIGVAREVFAAMLLQAWGLPECVVDTVRFQYASRYTGAHAGYVGLLRLTHQMLAPKDLCDHPKVPIDAALTAALDLEAQSVTNVMEVISESAAALDSMAQAATAR